MVVPGDARHREKPAVTQRTLSRCFGNRVSVCSSEEMLKIQVGRGRSLFRVKLRCIASLKWQV